MIKIKQAKRLDSKLILDFIKAIALYEKLGDAVEASVKDIETSIFDHQDAHVIIAYENDIPVGFALYFYNYSTFKGKKGLYLEDLFVKEAYRAKGIGNQLFDYLRARAKEENCGRMEWVCLNWNQSAIDFYRQKDAISMDDWTTFRIDEENL